LKDADDHEHWKRRMRKIVWETIFWWSFAAFLAGLLVGMLIGIWG